MNENFKNHLLNRGESEEKVLKALSYIEELYTYFISREATTLEVTDIKEYINYLIESDNNSQERLLTLARYFHFIDNKDVYIYFTTIFGRVGVIENIRERAYSVAGSHITESIFSSLKNPAFGSDSREYVEFTRELMGSLHNNLAEADIPKVLTGNNHNIPRDSFLNERDIYLKMDNLEDFLKDLHRRRVETLQEHCDQNKIWFEQVITQDVVEFVRSNQEILSAVKKGNKLYITKIPYDTRAYLNAKDDRERRYYACHCPFAREAIKSDKKIDKEWCYCSAGFAKFPFEVILGRELPIKLLETPFNGDTRCRFEIDLE